MTHPAGARVPWILTAAAILAQIAWPLTSGDMRVVNTTIVVLLFASAVVTHAWMYRGRTWALSYLVIVLIFGLGVEYLGVTTGWPFSAYEYTEALQPQILGVPVVVPLAWLMMAYPAWNIGVRLGSQRVLAIVIAAYSLTAWDLFLDPQMVNEGYWTWLSGLPGLPGIPLIPAVNYLGWFISSLVLMTALSLLPNREVPQGVPATLYGWTWIGGVIANLFFFGRPAVALWGGVLMGLVAIPYALSLRRQRISP
jgi:uncharacterized membrane protein